MNIIVCVKQVPDSSKIRIDPERNTLVRDGAVGILNPYDSYALEAAARIRDNAPDSTLITVISMGPASAESVLREALAMAADDAFLLTDARFAGSDTYVTSRILSEGIRFIEDSTKRKYDLIFCGRQATDGDTAQVGPELAEHLGYTQVTCAIETKIENGLLRVRQETDFGYKIIEADTPCIVTFTKPLWEPRSGTLKRTLAARKAEIHKLSFEDLCYHLSEEQIGLNGSPTRVRKTFTPKKSIDCIMTEGADDQTKGITLAQALCEKGIIK